MYYSNVQRKYGITWFSKFLDFIKNNGVRLLEGLNPDTGKVEGVFPTNSIMTFESNNPALPEERRIFPRS